jgi:hypothetical protein
MNRKWYNFLSIPFSLTFDNPELGYYTHNKLILLASKLLFSLLLLGNNCQQPERTIGKTIH